MASSMREEEFFLSSQRSFYIPQRGSMQILPMHYFAVFSVNIIFVPQKLSAMVPCIKEKTPNSADDKVSLHPRKAPA